MSNIICSVISSLHANTWKDSWSYSVLIWLEEQLGNIFLVLLLQKKRSGQKHQRAICVAKDKRANVIGMYEGLYRLTRSSVCTTRCTVWIWYCLTSKIMELRRPCWLGERWKHPPCGAVQEAVRKRDGVVERGGMLKALSSIFLGGKAVMKLMMTSVKASHLIGPKGMLRCVEMWSTLYCVPSHCSGIKFSAGRAIGRFRCSRRTAGRGSSSQLYIRQLGSLTGGFSSRG